jgi:hypothetical protein
MYLNTSHFGIGVRDACCQVEWVVLEPGGNHRTGRHIQHDSKGAIRLRDDLFKPSNHPNRGELLWFAASVAQDLGFRNKDYEYLAIALECRPNGIT